MQVKMGIDPESAAKLFCHILEKAELAALGSLPQLLSLVFLPSVTCPYYSLMYPCMGALLLGLFLTDQ